MEFVIAVCFVALGLFCVWLLLCAVEGDWILPESWKFFLSVQHWKMKKKVNGNWEIDMKMWPEEHRGSEATGYRLIITPPAGYEGFKRYDVQNITYRAPEYVMSDMVNEARRVISEHIEKTEREEVSKTIKV